MTALAAADLTATGIQIEAYKSPEADINEKFNQIIQANAFRSLADVSFIWFYQSEPLTIQKSIISKFLFFKTTAVVPERDSNDVTPDIQSETIDLNQNSSQVSDFFNNRE